MYAVTLQVLRELEYAGVPGLGDLWDVKVDGETELPAPRQAAALHCSKWLVTCAWSWSASDTGIWWLVGARQGAQAVLCMQLPA